MGGEQIPLVSKRRDNIMILSLSFYVGIFMVFVALQGYRPLEKQKSLELLWFGNILIIYYSFNMENWELLGITILMMFAQLTRINLKW